MTIQNPNFGWGKFSNVDEGYFKYIETLPLIPHQSKDLIYHFPVFVGHVNLGRHLFFYDLYRQVIDLNGHIADVGTYKGASFLFFAKLIRLFESLNTTQVHGFDWFQGMVPGENDDPSTAGHYVAGHDTLCRLIELQGLSDVAILHRMDLTKELSPFLQQNPYMRFKLVFVDCGIESVLESSLALLWPRLVNGGILIMDHYNNESSPTESGIVDRYIGNNRIRQVPYNRQPTGYVVKEF